MQKPLKLKYRLFFIILPLVIATVALSGLIAAMESEAALTRLANRHLAYKAEQLRNYFYSEWDVITNLNLDKIDAYKPELERSFYSYAFSLLREESEVILICDQKGKILKTITSDSLTGSLRNIGSLSAINGWFTENLLGQKRVGVVFDLEPVLWKVAFTDLHASFFSDVENIKRTFIIILIIALSVLIVLLSVFVSYIVKPLEKLTNTIGNISKLNDLSIRASVDYNDEIGLLATKFNAMIEALQNNYNDLEEGKLKLVKAQKVAIESEEETLFVLGRVSDFRDVDTGKHLRRIGILSALFSELLGQSKEQQEIMLYSAPLHDIGKIGISDQILRKPDKFEKDEYEAIKHHTVLGYEILKNTQGHYLVEGAAIALSHHERWDGTGYPYGITGDSIPLSGRIVSIVDVFDALISERPYKKAWTFEKAYDYIIEQRGKHFDPHLVDLFTQHYDRFRALFESVSDAQNASTP